MQPDAEGAARLHGRTAFSFDVVEAPQRYEFFASSAAVGCGAGAIAFTVEPELDPLTWEPVGGSAKKLRAYVRRLRRRGVEAVALRPGVPPEPKFRRAADALVAAWRRAAPARAYLLELDPWRRAQEKRYFAVSDPKDSDALWSLLVAHPVYGLEGWHLCHLIRHPDAPKGVAELVVASAIETLGDEGVRYATFGTVASLRAVDSRGFGPASRFALRAGYRLASRAVSHARAAQFPRKIQPGPWPLRYMVVFPRRAVASASLAMLRLAHAFGEGAAPRPGR